jgi:hypothetical protein
MKFLTILVTLVALAAFAALAAGCDTRSLSPKVSTGTGNTGGSIGPGGADGGGTFVPTRKLDMLFVIDRLVGGAAAAGHLMRNFPSFLTRPDGSARLPDLHIAVISTDMGAGDGSIASCDATGGKNGSFQHTARGTCTSTGLDPGATYIADNGLSATTPATIAMCSPASRRWRAGLRFRTPVRGDVARAGRRRPRGAAREPGFLRDDAYLVIIMLTNERRLLARRIDLLRLDDEHESRVPARPSPELPLQRVRPPVQRREAAAARPERKASTMR